MIKCKKKNKQITYDKPWNLPYQYPVSQCCGLVDCGLVDRGLSVGLGFITMSFLGPNYYSVHQTYFYFSLISNKIIIAISPPISHSPIKHAYIVYSTDTGHRAGPKTQNVKMGDHQNLIMNWWSVTDCEDTTLEDLWEAN